MFIDTVKFTLWKFCRLTNDSEWGILCLKGHGTQKPSVKALQTVKDEFYREIDLFGRAPEEKLLWTSINPRELSNSKMSKMINVENFADMFNLSADA